MKRKLIIVGIFLGLAVVLVVLASQQPAGNTGARGGFTLTTNGQIIVQPHEGSVTFLATMPKTNNTGSAPSPAK